MLKLMKMELKKYKINIKGVIIANLIILASLLLIILTSKATADMQINDYNSTFLITGTLVRAVFTIFAATLISKQIIGEYKNKTINVMFLYPIKRSKIMLSKLLVVVTFTLTTIFLSNILLDSILYILNIFMNFIKEPFTITILSKNLIYIIIYSIAYAFIALIPVYLGMRKKSGSVSIISGVIIVSIFNSGSGDFTLGSYLIVIIIAAFLGIISSYLAIKDIDNKDVIC